MDKTTTTPKVKKHRFGWLRRIRGPLIFVLIAGACMFARQRLELEPLYMHGLDLGAQILLVAAFGWTLTSVVDYMIARQLSRLKRNGSTTLDVRKRATRLDVLRRVWGVIGLFATIAAVLTVVPFARQIGVSLFASAGIAGIAIGIAARPVLSNLIAGLQIAFTQPIRIEDAVIVEGEWGWIEEIDLFYVVIRIWDWRRLVVPLAYFTEKPFQNWTRESSTIIGSITWDVDYSAPIASMRSELEAIVRRSPLWDKIVVVLQVIEAKERTITVRALASASSAQDAWDLRCFIREEMISWLQREHAGALPRVRAEALIPGGKASPEDVARVRAAAAEAQPAG